MSADDPDRNPQYAETFRYRTNPDLIDESRAKIETAATDLGLRLVSIDVTERRLGQVKMEITVVGDGLSINLLRERLIDASTSASAAGEEDIGTMVFGLIAAPILDAATTRARRGLWNLKRHRRQSIPAEPGRSAEDVD